MHFKTYHYLAAVVMAATAAQGALGQELIVTPQGALQAQVEKVSNRLDRLLDICNCISRSDSYGVSQVRFEADANGLPVNVRTFNTTGNMAVDRAATRVVSRLRGVDELLAAAPGKRTVQANIVIGRSYAEVEELQGVLAGMERERIAREGHDATVLALGPGAAQHTP